MTNTTSIVKVSIEQYNQGYLATSENLKGLFVSHRTLSKVYDSIPDAIRLLFKAKYDTEVMVEEVFNHSDGKHELKDIVFLAKAA